MSNNLIYTVAFRYFDDEYYTEFDTDKLLTFGNHKKDTVQIPNSGKHLLTLKKERDRIIAEYDRKRFVFEPNELEILEKDVAYVYVSRIAEVTDFLNLPYNGKLTCGRMDNNDIVLSYPIVSGRHFELIIENGHIHVEDNNSTNFLYLNGKRITKAKMQNGDILSIYTLRFVLRNGALYFENMGSSLRLSEEKKQNIVPINYIPFITDLSLVDLNGKYLIYHFSPRIREQLPKEDIVLSSPPSQMSGGRGFHGNLAYMISSGAMMAASIATGMVSPEMILMRAAGLISPVANMAMYGKLNKEQKKKLEEYEQLRQESYQEYIEDQKAKIAKVADIQRRVLLQENPEPRVCMTSAMELKLRLWERMSADSDFLTVRLGIGKDKLCVTVKSRTDMDGFHMPEDDELEKLSGQIIEETKYVDNTPIRISLKKYQSVGIVGDQQTIYDELRNIIVETASLHSFKDVRMVCIFGKDGLWKWGILRWLPHVGDETGQVRYIAFDKERIHTVCELLGDVINRRKAKHKNESGRETPEIPHYIVIVQNKDLIVNEPIYNNLISNDARLGVTTIFLGESYYDLPQTCQCIIDMTKSPIVFEREKFDERQYFAVDPVIQQKEMEAFARRLSAIEIEDTFAERSVPSSVTFLQGYGVETVEQLNIFERWNNSEPFMTLAAPIGVMRGGAIFSLDIRSGEKSHGPHGLLAGTTGSGKSELLQTWILSMAVNYHPHDVNFVIIDYKGGGMSDLLEPLPHVVGKITNIDRNISRSLVSLKSELKRREKLFSEAGVNNIDKYQKAFKAGQVSERLPHLIIVTDEFAELKKEEPEFMTELNSVATTGRSLGVHMLLATQKPAGVVNDQIDSNSRFRICMKVQDVADSREMLKRPDAARITQAGRAYIRVGEDELFELFQSFYSGAGYSGFMKANLPKENQVKIVGTTGNRISPLKKKKHENQFAKDQLTAVIDNINYICEKNHINKLNGPWLPELPHWIPLNSLDSDGMFDETGWNEKREGLKVPIGLYDMPALQMQGVQYLNFTETGHYAVYGMPGTGKTILLKTAVLSLGLFYSPRQVQISILDAASWSMQEFKSMPHVKEVITNAEEKEMHMFALRMKRELSTRKNAFLKASVNSLIQYHRTVSKDLPAIVIAVDQIGPLFEQFTDIAELFEEIAATGMTYGIYLIFTSNTTVGLRYKFLQMIKGAVALQMPEKGDYATIVGQIAGVSLPQLQGRAIIRGNPPIAFHTAMYIDEEEDQKRSAQLLQLLRNMRDVWNTDGENPTEKPIESSSQTNPNAIIIGQNDYDLSPVYVDLNGSTYTLLLTGKRPELIDSALNNLADSLKEKKKYQMIKLEGDTSDAVIADSLNYLVKVLGDRKKQHTILMKKADFDEKRWQEDNQQICLIMRNCCSIIGNLNQNQKKSLGLILTVASNLGIMVLCSEVYSTLYNDQNNPIVAQIIRNQKAVVLDGRPIDYQLFSINEQDNHIPVNELEKDESVLFDNGNTVIVRMKR